MLLLNGFWQVFAGGMIGVVVIELLKVVAWLNTGTFERKYNKLPYWGAIAAFLLLAGLSAVVDGVDQIPLKRVVQLGMNAPAIFGGLATAARLRKQTNRAKKQAAAFMGEMIPEVAKTPSRWSRFVDAMAWA